jgi:hypothetical protein
MGIETYLAVVFWWGLAGVIISALTIMVCDYPRKLNLSVGEDLIRLLITIFLFAWVCYLRNTVT